MSDKVKDEKNPVVSKKVYVVLFSIVISLWVGSFFIMKTYSEIPGDRGLLGDQFGAVNSLFSGLAFAGLIITILLQRRELTLQRNDLELQRNEMELQREEMKSQRREMKGQKDSMNLQRFETKFFHLMDSYYRILDSIQVIKGDNIYRGRDFIMLYINSVFKLYHNRESKYYLKAAESCESIFIYWRHSLMLYFDFILAFLKHLDQDKSVGKEKYIHLFSAQLSYPEKIAILYHVSFTSDDHFSEITAYINEYDILKGMKYVPNNSIKLLPLKDLAHQLFTALRDQVVAEK